MRTASPHATRAGTVELVGSPTPNSRTRGLTRAVTAELIQMGAAPAGSQLIDLSQVVGVTFSSQPAVAADPQPDPFAAVCDAALLIVASPVYKATYTGLLKIFLDRLPRKGLTGTVAIPIVLADARAHCAPAARSLTELLNELGATVPAALLAASEHNTELKYLATTWVARHGCMITEALDVESAQTNCT